MNCVGNSESCDDFDYDDGDDDFNNDVMILTMTVMVSVMTGMMIDSRIVSETRNRSNLDQL